MAPWKPFLLSLPHYLTEWPCGRFFPRILLWPCQYRIVVLPTVRWRPGHTNVCCWVPTSATPHLVSSRISHCPQISLWGSPVILQLFSRLSSTVWSNWLPPCAEWQEQLEVLSQRDSAPTLCCELAIPWSLTGFMYYILAFGLVCLLLVFWECVINGAQWAVNERKNVNFGSLQMYVAMWDTRQISSHASFCLSCDEKCFDIQFHWY